MKNKFNPDYIVKTGEILDEHLEATGMKKNVFARLCKCSPKKISQIISGVAPVTVKTALMFEKHTGLSAELWMNLETSYRIKLERKKCILKP